jgi:DNA-binding transcriptional regulator YhcF (GntR family)
MEIRIDPDSPIPLYHQIAEAIRAAIEAGSLSPGDALEPMRRAAETWRVNIHTVRHAYAALARDGLIERSRGPRGTRVVGGGTPGGSPKTDRNLEEFLSGICREATDRFGLGSAELAACLDARTTGRRSEKPVVYVVECSLWQCESHGRELSARFRVEARPWPLSRVGEPPAGPVISTFFHYNDLRRQWPRRLPQIHFLTITPDPGIRKSLAGVKRVLICERDAATAETLVGDLSTLFGEREIEIEPLVLKSPAAAPLRSRTGPPILFAPRVWAMLSEKTRSHPRARQLRYVLDSNELTALGYRLQWQPRTGAAA